MSTTSVFAELCRTAPDPHPNAKWVAFGSYSVYYHGMIAAALALKGHDVEAEQCHRGMTMSYNIQLHAQAVKLQIRNAPNEENIDTLAHRAFTTSTGAQKINVEFLTFSNLDPIDVVEPVNNLIQTVTATAVHAGKCLDVASRFKELGAPLLDGIVSKKELADAHNASGVDAAVTTLVKSLKMYGDSVGVTFSALTADPVEDKKPLGGQDLHDLLDNLGASDVKLQDEVAKAALGKIFKLTDLSDFEVTAQPLSASLTPTSSAQGASFDCDTTDQASSTLAPVKRVLDAHAAQISCVAYSPGGTRFVTGSGDKSVAIWKFDGTLIKRVPDAHTDWIWCVTYSPDGSQFVTGSCDMSIGIWKPDGSLVKRVPNAHTRCIRCVAYSPDGTQFVTGSDDKSVAIWKPDGTLIKRVPNAHTDWITAIAYSPDGTHFVTTSGDRSISIWKSDGSLVKRVPNAHTRCIRCVAYSPDGTQFVTGSDDKSVAIWKPDGTLVKRVADAHTGWIRCVAYSPDGTQFVTGSDYGSLAIWKPDGTLIKRVLAAYTSCIRCIAYSPYLTRFVMVSSNQFAIWKYASTCLDEGGDSDHTASGDDVPSANDTESTLASQTLEPTAVSVLDNLVDCFRNPTPASKVLAGHLTYTLANYQYGLADMSTRKSEYDKHFKYIDMDLQNAVIKLGSTKVADLKPVDAAKMKFMTNTSTTPVLCLVKHLETGNADEIVRIMRAFYIKTSGKPSAKELDSMLVTMRSQLACVVAGNGFK